MPRKKMVTIKLTEVDARLVYAYSDYAEMQLDALREIIGSEEGVVRVQDAMRNLSSQIWGHFDRPMAK